MPWLTTHTWIRGACVHRPKTATNANASWQMRVKLWLPIAQLAGALGSEPASGIGCTVAKKGCTIYVVMYNNEICKDTSSVSIHTCVRNPALHEFCRHWLQKRSSFTNQKPPLNVLNVESLLSLACTAAVKGAERAACP